MMFPQIVFCVCATVQNAGGDSCAELRKILSLIQRGCFIYIDQVIGYLDGPLIVFQDEL